MIFPKFSTTIGILCFVLTPRTANFVWASSRNLNDPPEVSHKMYLKWVRIVQGLALNRLALLGPYLKNEMKKRCWFWIVRNFIIRRKKLLPFFRLNPKRIPWTNLTSRSSDPVDFKFFTKNRFWPFSTREQWKNIKIVISAIITCIVMTLNPSVRYVTVFSMVEVQCYYISSCER